MASAARQQSHAFPARKSASAILLAELKQAHDFLLREMGNLDEITLGLQPDPAELTAARWRLSQASLRRRALSARILDFLADRVSGHETARLNALQSENRLAMSKSAQHVHAWTISAIGEDWRGYCRASLAIRMEMKANILLEKQSLYPILGELAARGM